MRVNSIMERWLKTLERGDGGEFHGAFIKRAKGAALDGSSNNAEPFKPIMEETLFSKIIARKIPAKVAFEDDRFIAIHDISPQAPVHILVITKKVIPTLNDVKAEDVELVGGMFQVAAKLMKQLGHSDYRTVFNCGPGAQQTVFHLHLHVLAGRPFTWPPG
jgi:histidine triad (HIT) family protein